MKIDIVKNGPFYGCAIGFGFWLAFVATDLLATAGLIGRPYGAQALVLGGVGGAGGVALGVAFRRRFPRREHSKVSWSDLDGSSLPRTRWFVVATGAVVAASMGAGFTYMWFDWTVFALAIAALFFMGGLRLMPWRTPLRKAITLGISVGLMVGSMIWLSHAYGN